MKHRYLRISLRSSQGCDGFVDADHGKQELDPPHDRMRNAAMTIADSCPYNFMSVCIGSQCSPERTCPSGMLARSLAYPSISVLEEGLHQGLQVLCDLARSDLAGPVHPLHELDGHLRDLVPVVDGLDHGLHLKGVARAEVLRQDVLENLLPV